MVPVDTRSVGCEKLELCSLHTGYVKKKLLKMANFSFGKCFRLSTICGLRRL